MEEDNTELQATVLTVVPGTLSLLHEQSVSFTLPLGLLTYNCLYGWHYSGEFIYKESNVIIFLRWDLFCGPG
jgi:hypothetical protein